MRLGPEMDTELVEALYVGAKSKFLSTPTIWCPTSLARKRKHRLGSAIVLNACRSLFMVGAVKAWWTTNGKYQLAPHSTVVEDRASLGQLVQRT